MTILNTAASALTALTALLDIALRLHGARRKR